MEKKESSEEKERNDERKERERILKNAYYNIKLPGSLSTVDKLKRQVSKDIKNITKTQVLDFLLAQPTYTRFKERRERFPTRKVYRGKVAFFCVASDLADMSAMKTFNSGYCFIAVFRDLFSNYLILEKIKNKDKPSMKECLDRFVSRVPAPFKVKLLWTDRGKCNVFESMGNGI